MTRYMAMAIVAVSFFLGSCDSQAFPEGTYESDVTGSLFQYVISPEQIIFDDMSVAEKEEVAKHLRSLGLPELANACLVEEGGSAILTYWKSENGKVSLPEMNIIITEVDEAYFISSSNRADNGPGLRFERVGAADTTLCEKLWRRDINCKKGEVSNDEAREMALGITQDLQPSKELVSKIKKMMGDASRVRPEVCRIRTGFRGAPEKIMVEFEGGYDPKDIQEMEGFPEVKEVRHEVRVGRYDYYVISFVKPINTVPVVDRFRESPGVKSMRTSGGGWAQRENIRIKHENGTWELSYNLGGGDCPSGCTEFHQWLFIFDDEGKLLDSKETQDGKEVQVGTH